jgi:2-aminoadipate transaminase
MTFDHASLFRDNLPAAAIRFTGFPEFNFVGGHNDADNVPVAGLRAAADAVIARDGAKLAATASGRSRCGGRRRGPD